MDFPFDNLGNNNLGLGATPSKVNTDYYDKTLLSFFARANYNYDNRYLLTATYVPMALPYSPKKTNGVSSPHSPLHGVYLRKLHEDLKWISTSSSFRLGYRG